MSIDGRGDDTSNTTHSDDNGGGDRLLGVSDGVGSLESKDRGDVGCLKVLVYSLACYFMILSQSDATHLELP